MAIYRGKSPKWAIMLAIVLFLGAVGLLVTSLVGGSTGNGSGNAAIWVVVALVAVGTPALAVVADRWEHAVAGFIALLLLSLAVLLLAPGS